MSEPDFTYLDAMQRDDLLKECLSAGIPSSETEFQAAALLRMTLKERLKQQHLQTREIKRDRRRDIPSDHYPSRHKKIEHGNIDDDDDTLPAELDGGNQEKHDDGDDSDLRNKDTMLREERKSYASDDEQREDEEEEEEEVTHVREDEIEKNAATHNTSSKHNQHAADTTVDHVKHDMKTKHHMPHNHHEEVFDTQSHKQQEQHQSQRQQQQQQQQRPKQGMQPASLLNRALNDPTQNLHAQSRQSSGQLRTSARTHSSPAASTMQQPASCASAISAPFAVFAADQMPQRKNSKPASRSALSPLARLLEDEYDPKITECMQAPSLEELLTKHGLFELHAYIVDIQHQGWSFIPDNDFLDSDDRELLQASDKDNPLVKLYYAQADFVKGVDALYVSRQKYFENKHQALHVKIVAKQKLLHTLLGAAEAKRKHIWGAVMQQLEPNTFAFVDAKKTLLADHQMDLMLQNQTVQYGKKETRSNANSKS